MGPGSSSRCGLTSAAPGATSESTDSGPRSRSAQTPIGSRSSWGRSSSTPAHRQELERSGRRRGVRWAGRATSPRDPHEQRVRRPRARRPGQGPGAGRYRGPVRCHRPPGSGSWCAEGHRLRRAADAGGRADAERAGVMSEAKHGSRIVAAQPVDALTAALARPTPVSSLAARLPAISAWWATAQLAIAVTGSISDRPSSVSSYSTRGGTSA